MTEAEIAGHMNWRGPGAYTAYQMKRIKALLAEAELREREACAKVVEQTKWSNWFQSDCAAAIRARGEA